MELRFSFKQADNLKDAAGVTADAGDWSLALWGVSPPPFTAAPSLPQGLINFEGNFRVCAVSTLERSPFMRFSSGPSQTDQAVGRGPALETPPGGVCLLVPPACGVQAAPSIPTAGVDDRKLFWGTGHRHLCSKHHSPPPPCSLPSALTRPPTLLELFWPSCSLTTTKKSADSNFPLLDRRGGDRVGTVFALGEPTFSPDPTGTG